MSSKKANNWGLHDLYGNVMEWVQNYYKPNYFPSVRQSDNSNDLNVPENEKYPLRVVRGGAWGGLHGAGTPEGLRSAKRYAFVSNNLYSFYKRINHSRMVKITNNGDIQVLKFFF